MWICLAMLTTQFLFIDLALILPIAIFSKLMIFLSRTLVNNKVVSWAGPYQVLCRKRPTASLVSRKVLVPLLGQITLCVLIQFIGFEAVQNEPWYYKIDSVSDLSSNLCRFVPPQLDRDKSNIVNSENTTLFLIS